MPIKDNGRLHIECTTLVKISDPIFWHDRITWIYNNCSKWEDATNWAGWQIGLSDIEIYMSERDAVYYYLRWE